MSIKVRFFASLAESIGRREAELSPAAGTTVESVWLRFSGGKAPPEGLLCAVNHDYCMVEQALDDGDEVAFFPPVTGG